MSVFFQLHLLIRSVCTRRTSEGKIDWPLPSVTVQVPVYNERHVIAQLLNALADIGYPNHLYDIQILDDSTDETSSIIDSHVVELKKKGFDVNVLRRNVRNGFKAGALQNGLRQCKGELIAVFDADFIPPPDTIMDGPTFQRSRSRYHAGQMGT